MVTSPFYLKGNGWPPSPLLCKAIGMDTSPFSPKRNGDGMSTVLRSILNEILQIVFSSYTTTPKGDVHGHRSGNGMATFPFLLKGMGMATDLNSPEGDGDSMIS